MAKKLIVTDLDGTLLKNDKSISQYTINTIQKVCEEGHKFVIATARPYRATNKIREILQVDAGIYHNGALIYMDDKKIDSFQINNPKEVVDHLLEVYPECKIAIESNDILYANFNVEVLWANTDYILTKDFMETRDKKADKIIIVVSSLEDMKKYENQIPKELYIQLSENKIGMIMRRDATKRNGVYFLAKKYKIDISNVIAFGDDYNDIDMLKCSGQGICVANAIDEVKSIADLICESNENDGVAKWLEKNVLA